METSRSKVLGFSSIGGLGRSMNAIYEENLLRNYISTNILKHWYLQSVQR